VSEEDKPRIAGRIKIAMGKWWVIFFIWSSFFEGFEVISFPTDTVRRALENKKLLDRAKDSNYSIVYSWFPSSSNREMEQQQLEASVSSFKNHYYDIPIHLFTSLNNFSSHLLIIHRIDAPASSSLEMTHSLLYGLIPLSLFSPRSLLFIAFLRMESSSPASVYSLSGSRCHSLKPIN
jgi:hypothetical protein